jgi:asparagine synthase (glutamine-hydrolysing)
MELIDQPKRGFEIPLKSWVDNELKQPVFDYLDSYDCFYKNFVQEKFVRNLLSKKIKIAPEKRAKILWSLLSMEIWYKKTNR